jgi:serine/threonine-protein kinase
MGEVWRAEDTKLGREVALKVLPEEFAKDPERMARFEREAKVLASLNHPNIATLYGLETVDSGSGSDSSPEPRAPSPVTFLAMELVEGEDLSERIARGPVPVEEAIPIALQIAEALEAAHEQGIVHRDLKPANIKLTEDGVVKVLDFGLAKAWESDQGDSRLSLSPTLTAHGTAAGVVLGTAAYMSPEQARGKRVDRRADIWSFGVVLWEMLTGRKLFEGETVTDVLAAVLTREIDLGTLPLHTPVSIRRLLRRCLERGPRKRLQWIGDARLELETSAEEPAAVSLHTAKTAWLGWVVGAVASCVAIGLLGWTLFQSGKPTQPPLHVDIDAAGFNSFSASAISPDGRHVAYFARDDDGVHRLELRGVDGFEIRSIPGTEGGENPIFSPDGKWVAVFDPQRRTIEKVSVGGGSVQRIPGFSIAGYYNSGTWHPDGFLILSGVIIDGDQWRGLVTVSDVGGTPEILTTPQRSENRHYQPEIVDGTAWVLYSYAAEGDKRYVAAVSRDTGEQKVVLEDATTAIYLRSGHLLAFRPAQNDMVIAEFDAETASVIGEPRPVLAQVGGATRDSGQFALSDNGTLIYNTPLGRNVNFRMGEVVLVDRDGRISDFDEEPQSWSNPRFSPDGKSILLRRIQNPRCELWIRDLQRGTTTRITFEHDTHDPLWHPNGREVMYAQDMGDHRSVYRSPSDGSGSPTLMVDHEASLHPASWSADGRRLALAGSDLENGGDLWVLDDQIAPDPTEFLATRFGERHPSFSPNGRWIAYASDESGRFEVFVRPYPSAEGRTQISTDGGFEPLWSPDGAEIYYRTGSKLMAVEVSEPDGWIRAGYPRELFDDVFEVSSPATPDQINYDISPDGSLFAMVRPDPEAGDARPLRMVVGWVDAMLKELDEK